MKGAALALGQPVHASELRINDCGGLVQVATGLTGKAQAADGQGYGMALQKESPYRERINQVILQLEENGIYNQIYERWFGKDNG